MKLSGKRVILASGSPRRKELLGRITEDFEIKVADVDESLGEGITPEEGVEILALRKGAAVAADAPDALVISSDTLVELEGEPLGKPRDFDDAVNMLTRMSGKTHMVRTGVAVHYMGHSYSGVDSVAVHFRNIPEWEILDYVRGGEPMDKAGAYGIQGEGGKFVLGYDGDFDTVMGLSLELTRRLIQKALEAYGD